MLRFYCRRLMVFDGVKGQTVVSTFLSSRSATPTVCICNQLGDSKTPKEFYMKFRFFGVQRANTNKIELKSNCQHYTFLSFATFRCVGNFFIEQNE
jgi:hypothetical protein